MTAPFTFNELVHARAADPKTANKLMARLGERSLTYAEYEREAAAWAHLMLARRANAGAPPRVAVLMQNSLEILLAYGGAALSGGMAFALNTGLSGDPLARVVEQSGADLLLADAPVRQSVDQGMSLFFVQVHAVDVSDGEHEDRRDLELELRLTRRDKRRDPT